jgi:AraC family transcriptional regulator
MAGSIADTERERRIHRVIDYLLAHPMEDHSLHTLANVANYSPFHLQKIFKQTVGESPKQYMLKLRLETAFHLLIIHPQKSVQEIAMDCGFSSLSSFTRAVKNYFGHAPGELRRLPHRRQMKLLHTVNKGAGGSARGRPVGEGAVGGGAAALAERPVIHPIKITTIRGVYILTPFDDPGAIREAFRELTRMARANDLSAARLYGILTPHQRNSYRAFLACDLGVADADRFNHSEIPGGKFAAFTIKGDLTATNKAIHYFYQRWLPDNGYKIAGVSGFETFAEDPSTVPFYQLERKIHIPIEPVR